MHCHVVELFHHGMRRSGREVKDAAPLKGHLLFARNSPEHVGTVAWLKRDGNASGGYLHSQTDVLLPLIHAELAGINAHSMVIRGVQMRRDERDMRAELQAWWIRLSLGDE